MSTQKQLRCFWVLVRRRFEKCSAGLLFWGMRRTGVGGGVREGCVYSGWLQLWGDQFSPACYNLAPAVFLCFWLLLFLPLLSGSHKCDLYLLWFVTLLLLSSGVLFGWRGSSSHLRKLKKTKKVTVKIIHVQSLKAYTLSISVHEWIKSNK